MKGTPECLAAMARLLERHLVKGHSVDPANLVIGSGEPARADAVVCTLQRRPCIACGGAHGSSAHNF